MTDNHTPTKLAATKPKDSQGQKLSSLLLCLFTLIAVVLTVSLVPKADAANLDNGGFCITATYGDEGITGTHGPEFCQMDSATPTTPPEAVCTPQMIEARWDAEGARLSQRVMTFILANESDATAKFQSAFADPRIRIVETKFAANTPAISGLQPPNPVLPSANRRAYPGVQLVADKSVQANCTDDLIYSAGASISVSVVGDIRTDSTSTDWSRAFTAQADSGTVASYQNGMGTPNNAPSVDAGVAKLKTHADEIRRQAQAYMIG